MTTSEATNHLPKLDSGQNFRDIGGYHSLLGKSVRWKQVYRSGHMAGISHNDQKILRDLGITNIFDLRANDERLESPTEWHQNTPTNIWFRDHDFSAGALLSARLGNENDATKAREAMIEVYERLPIEQVDSFSYLFERLATAPGPIVYNCSAGKDRTGLATALLLEILKVDREDIIQDYLLSNDHIGSLINYMEKSPKYRKLMVRNQQNILPLMRVERSYLEASYASIEDKFGTVSEYIESELHIGKDQKNALRELLLEPLK